MCKHYNEKFLITDARRRVRKPTDLPQELIVDRPFVYIIEVHGYRLFAGIVNVPDFKYSSDFLRDEL